MSRPSLTRGDGSFTVAAEGYQLFVGDGALGAVLGDRAGAAWSQLSLLASLDRVDCADESYALGSVEVAEGDGFVELTLATSSTAWESKSVRLRCFADRLEHQVTVTGQGVLGDARLFGGRAVLSNGASGVFRSSIEFASVFDPTPTEPIQVVRSAATAATVGAVGDASPGRLHGVFAPPPLCLAFGRAAAPSPTALPDGDWFSLGVVAPVPELRFTELRYAPEDGGFLVELDYDGHTSVAGSFTTPLLVLRPAASPVAALAAYRADLVERGFAPAGPVMPAARWWREPLFCGWGAQCAAAAERSADHGDVAHRATDLARADRYDAWLERLAAHGVVPGTVVIDDQWESVYGSGEPHPERWPDLRGWIADRHAAGQRVLLWWKAWDPAALTPEQCVVTPDGMPVAADPGSPAYVEHVSRVVRELLGPDGLDADGLKLDFLQRTPAGRGLHRPGAAADAPWGIALLHALLAAVARAARDAKPDALLITHTPHPGFGDVTDMLRLNDLLVHALSGEVVPPAAQLAFRHAVVAASMPGHLIDTDQWPIATREQWRDYVVEQATRGVPSLYYAERLHFSEHLHFAERIDRPGDRLDAADLELLARSWAAYRATLA